MAPKLVGMSLDDLKKALKNKPKTIRIIWEPQDDAPFSSLREEFPEIVARHLSGYCRSQLPIENKMFTPGVDLSKPKPSKPTVVVTGCSFIACGLVLKWLHVSCQDGVVKECPNLDIWQCIQMLEAAKLLQADLIMDNIRSRMQALANATPPPLIHVEKTLTTYLAGHEYHILMVSIFGNAVMNSKMPEDQTTLVSVKEKHPDFAIALDTLLAEKRAAAAEEQRLRDDLEAQRKAAKEIQDREWQVRKDAEKRERKKKAQEQWKQVRDAKAKQEAEAHEEARKKAKAPAMVGYKPTSSYLRPKATRLQPTGPKSHDEKVASSTVVSADQTAVTEKPIVLSMMTSTGEFKKMF